MRKLLFLFCGLILSGCDLNHVVNEVKPPSYESLVNMARNKAVVKLKHERKLNPCGTGGQTKLEQVKMLALSFNYYEPVDIEKGRELLLASVYELTHAINEDDRLKPHLYNYPFESKNVEIRIFIYQPDGSHVSSGELSVICANEGELEYNINDFGGEYRFKKILKETYQEALQKQDEFLAQKALTEKIAM